MLAMGYGGSRPDAGQRIGRGGDGGIDGVINEDALGLDIVYLQAKRYVSENTVGVVREFAGALVERGATKGVFVTTSRFAPGARTYADRVPQRLIPIDGEELYRLRKTDPSATLRAPGSIASANGSLCASEPGSRRRCGY